MIENLFSITVSDKYDTIATVAFLVVLVYGASLAIDVAKKSFTDSLPRQKLDELIDLLALQTGKPASDIRKVVDARFQKPAAAKRVVNEAKRFFLPSQKDRNAPVTFDRDRVGRETVQQVPYPSEADKSQDFDRYTPYSAIDLENTRTGQRQERNWMGGDCSGCIRQEAKGQGYGTDPAIANLGL